MAKKEGKDEVRISFNIPRKLQEKAEAMPWGVRTRILAILLERILDAADKYGSMIYGALLDGDFEITYKEKKR
jgi:hypothetical protein|tara:strand:- start:6671 stop:6889 length:219 start_codon:yes stop_codon:yes gene_type:complete